MIEAIDGSGRALWQGERALSRPPCRKRVLGKTQKRLAGRGKEERSVLLGRLQRDTGLGVGCQDFKRVDAVEKTLHDIEDVLDMNHTSSMK